MIWLSLFAWGVLKTSWLSPDKHKPKLNIKREILNVIILFSNG